MGVLDGVRELGKVVGEKEGVWEVGGVVGAVDGVCDVGSLVGEKEGAFVGASDGTNVGGSSQSAPTVCRISCLTSHVWVENEFLSTGRDTIGNGGLLYL